MYPSGASSDLATITSDYVSGNIFYTDGSMVDNEAGFAVHNINYETGHQLTKPSSVFSAEISAIRMAIEHSQVCPRGQYLILSDSLRVYPLVYASVLSPSADLQQIPSPVEISGNEIIDGLARQHHPRTNDDGQ
jgi:hypothetical protein